MATGTRTAPPGRAPEAPDPPPIPPLRNGDRLTAAEFERRHQAMPHLKKAELIEGVVYVPSPVSEDHGPPHFDATGPSLLDRAATPGVVGSDNGTVRLDLDNRPQPDIHLRILESHGGQSRVSADRYVEGAPELIVEIAASGASHDLHDELNVYRRSGVREYVVWRVEDGRIDWFAPREGRYEPPEKSPEGLYRSEVFPGLRPGPEAPVRGDLGRVFDVARQAIGSADHAASVERLARRAADRAERAEREGGPRP